MERNWRCSRVVVAVLTAAGTAGNFRAYADDWPMGFHDAAHTGRTAEIVTPPLTLLWTWHDTDPYDTDPRWSFQGTGGFSLPIYYQGRLYFQGNLNANRLHCIDPATGTQLWESITPGYTASGTYLFQFDNYPVAADGRILTTSTDFTATRDAVTGQDYRNTYNVNGGDPSGGSAVWHDKVYFQFLSTDPPNTEFMSLVHDPLSAFAQYGNGLVLDYVTNIYDWAMKVPAVGDFVTYAAVAGHLVAWDAVTNNRLWVWGSNYRSVSPALWNGTLFAYASTPQELQAIDPRPVTTNFGAVVTPPTVLWRKSMAPAYAPIVSDGILYVGSADQNFYAIDARTGATRWQFPTGAPFTYLQIAAISGNLIYIPGADGVLYVLDKNSGTEVWRYTGTNALGPIAIGDGRIFTSDAQNTIYAFQAQTAAAGPAITTLSRRWVNPGDSFSITGSGFTTGGGVLSITLDDPSHTALSGYSVQNDGSISGAVLPSGLAAGTYRLYVKTGTGTSNDSPMLELMQAGAIHVTKLGTSDSNFALPTANPTQRHLARSSAGTVYAVYPGMKPDSNGTIQLSYSMSRNGGVDWSGQANLFHWQNGQGMNIWSPTSSLWIDSSDQLNLTYTYSGFQKFVDDGHDLLQPAPGPVTAPAPDTWLWSGTQVAEPGGRLWTAYGMSQPPTAAVDASGPTSVYASYSDDGGQTWNFSTPISANGSPPALALVHGKPIVIYQEGGVLAYASWDGSQWSAPRTIPGSFTCVGLNMSATTLSNGNLQVAFQSGGIRVLSFDGASWSAAVTLDPAGTSPSLTTNGSDLWCFYTNAAGDLVYQRTSNGQGNQWGAVSAVTNDGNHNTAASTLILSPDAAIPVLWTSGSGGLSAIKTALVPSVPLNVIRAPCDVNQDGATNVLDVQLEVNQALQVIPCTGDINQDEACNILDVQRVVNAALGEQCVSP